MKVLLFFEEFLAPLQKLQYKQEVLETKGQTGLKRSLNPPYSSRDLGNSLTREMAIFQVECIFHT